VTAPDPLPPAPAAPVEVAVIGAGLAGVTTALLVRRLRPGAAVVLLEESARPADSGTSEPLEGPASLFYQLALRAADLLAREHLPRHGEHFWLARDPRAALADLAEVDADEPGSCPAHHVDAARLAAALRGEAAAQGIEVRTGARVLSVEVARPASRVRLDGPEGPDELRARWVVDASGERALLATALGLARPLGAPEVFLAAANWTGLAPLDGPSTASGPAAASRSRALATHEFPGPGRRVRLAPHVGGGWTVELLIEADLWRELAGARPVLEAYSSLVRELPGLRELLRVASVDPASLRARRRADRRAERRGGPGWFLVGEAALPPLGVFGSPLEALARTAWNAAEVIAADLAGELDEGALSERLQRYDLRERQLDAADAHALRAACLEVTADAELLTAAYGLWRAMRAREVARIGADPARLSAVSWHTLWQHSLVAGLHARLGRVARERARSGRLGAANAGRRVRFGPSGGSLKPLLVATRAWLGLEHAELREALRPVEHDPRTPAGPELARRAAALAEPAPRGPSPPTIE
jgi:hypothetical protein